MKTIEFDLEKAKSGDYVIKNSSGNPVRIICWDYPDEKYPLIGLVNTGEREYVCYYNEHGESYLDTQSTLHFEVEDGLTYDGLSKFEKAVGLEFWKDEDVLERNDPEILTKVHAIAGRLYDVAIRQFMADNNRDVQYDGLADCTKDMDVICRHIDDSRISDEVNTRLHKCGWFVCDNVIMKRLRDEIERMVEITDFLMKDKS